MVGRTNSGLWPKHLVTLSLLISLLSLHTFAAAAPSDTASSPEVLKYAAGKTYQYTFESQSVTELSGTSAEKSTVQLRGDAFLAVTQNDFVLTLQNVRLVSPSGKTVDKLADLEGSSVRFSYSNGQISQFRVSESDPTWSKNIKRAVASLLVNHAVVNPDIPRVQYLEEDVSGHNCPTDYVISGSGQFKKTRDLNRCAERDGGFSTQFGVPYKLPSGSNLEIKSDTTVDSDQTCDQVFENGILKHTTCSETHRVTVLNNGDAGARATISSSLKLVTTQDGTPTAQTSTATRPCTLHFIHSIGLNKGAKAAAISLELLKSFCTEVGDGVLGEQTADAFLRLKRNLKDVSEDSLEALYGKLDSGEICKDNDKVVKLFTDAIASTGSSDSISFIATLISAGKVSKNTQRLFRLYTAFADKPKEKALVSLKNLIQRSDADPRLFLTASGLARQYYRSKGAAAGASTSYVAISDEIAKTAAANCLSSDEASQKKAVSALQALGNFNSLSSKSVDAIISCFAGSNRIKVHALQAFRSDPCQANLKAEAKKILESQLQPSNLRIHAYLSFAQCYTPEDSTFFRNLIEAEDAVQVFAFIKSHRENLHGSREGARILEREFRMFYTTRQQFSGISVNDARKFSQNLEYSSFDDATTFTGYKTEANLIYAQDSFLPKTISANCSIDLYGRTFNLLEVGLNLGDFDNVFENLFGPRGDFPSVFDEKEKRKRGRGKRGARPVINKNDLDFFHNTVQTDAGTRAVERSDVFLRIAGTTILAKTFDLEDMLPGADNYNFGDSVVNAVKGAADIDFTEPFPLYGDELSIPTVSGLPLIVQVEGSAIFSLQLKNELSEDLNVYKPRFAPSASIENKLKMALGSEFFEAGFGVDTKVHAAIDVSVKGLLKSGEKGKLSYDLSLTIPKEKLNILDITNELYWVEEFGNDDSPTRRSFVPSTQQKVYGDKCCDAARSILNLNACYSAKVTSGRRLPDFPISGPAKISVTLAKAEPSKPYELNLKLQLDVSEPYSFLVSLDTPGSEKSKKVEIKGSYFPTNEEKSIRKLALSLDSPWKKLSITSDYEFDPELKKVVESIKIKIGVDGAIPTEVFNLKVSDEIVQGAETGSTHTKSLELVAGSLTQPAYLTASGTVVASSSPAGFLKEATLKDIQFNLQGTRIFVINGRVHEKLVDLDTKFRFGGPENDLKINGELSFPETNRQLFKGTVSSTSLRLLNAAVELDGTSREESNLEYLRKTSFKLSNAAKELVTFNFLAAKSGSSVEYGGGFKVAYPSGSTNQFTFDRLLDNEKYRLTYDTTLGPIVSNAELNFLRKEKTYNLKALLSVFGQDIALKSLRSTSSKPGEPVEAYEHSLSLAPGPNFKLDTRVYEETSVTGNWKKRVSQISSSLLDADRTLTIKYDLNDVKRSKLRATGSGTVDIEVTAGEEKRAKIVFTSQIPKFATEDFSVNLQAFVVNKVDSDLKIVIAQSKKNLFDVSGRLSLPRSGCTVSLKTNVVTNYLTQEPKKSTQITFDLKLDEGKSSASSFYYFSDTQSTNDDNLICDSKNQIVISGKTYQVNTKVKLAQSLSGDHSISLHVQPPTKEDFHFDLAVNLQNEDTTKFGTFVLDIAVPNDRTTKVKWDIGFKNLNLPEKQFRFSSNYEVSREGLVSLKTKKGRNYPAMEFVVSSQFKDGKQLVELSYSEGGVVVVTPIEYNVKIEIGTGEYGLTCRSGTDDSADTLLDINIKKSTSALKTYTVGLVYDKAVEEGRAPDVKTTLAYAYRYASITDFEFKESFELQTQDPTNNNNNVKASATRNVKVGPGLIDVLSEVTLTRGSQAATKDHSLKFYLSREEKKITGVFELHDKGLGHLTKNPLKTDASLNFEINRDYPNIHLTITGKFPNFDYENFRIKIDHDKHNNGQVRNTTIEGKLDDLQIVVVSNIENAPGKKTLDWALNLNNDPPRKLTLVYNEAAMGPSIEAFVQWDNGKEISSTGSLQTSETGFDAKFNFDSPTLTNKWKLAVSRQAEPLKRSFRITAESPDTQEIVSFSYDKKENQKSGKISLNGNGKVKLSLKQKKINLNGGVEVLVDKQYYDEGRTVRGRSLKAKLNFQSDKRNGNFSIEAGTSERAKLVHILTCSSPDHCLDVNAQLSQEKGKEGYQGSITRGSSGAGVSLDITTSEDSETRIRSLRVFKTENGDTKDLKLKIYRQPGTAADLDLSKANIKFTPTTISNRGIEIEFEGKTLVGLITKATSENVDGYSIEASFRLRPNQKVAVTWSKFGADVNEEGQGQDVNVGFRHYLLQRDLRANVHYRYGVTNKVFDLKTDLDIFAREQDKLVLSAQLNQNTNSGPATFEIGLSANSDGQGISLTTNCKDVKIEERSLSLSCDFSGKVGGTERKFSLNYARNNEEKTIELKNQERFFFYNRSLTYRVFPDSENPNRSFGDPNLNLEFQLPGMLDTRVFQYRASFPFTVSLKSRATSNQDDFSEVWLGSTRTQAYGFGVIENSKSERINLVDVELAKIRKQLSVRFDWDRESIIKHLNRRLNRLKQTTDGLVKFTQEAFAGAEDTAQGICASFSKSSQDFEPLRQQYETLINKVGNALGQNTNFAFRRQSSSTGLLASLKNAVIGGINGVYSGFEKLTSAEQGFLNSVSKLESFPRAEVTARRVTAVRQAVQSAAQAIRNLIAQGKPIKEKYPILQKIATKLREKIVDKVKLAFSATQDDLDDLFPYPEVKTFLRDFVDYLEGALLRPQEVTSDQKSEIIGKLDKAVEQILTQTFAVDFSKGRAVVNIPLLHRANSIKNLFKCDKEADDPLAEFLQRLVKNPREVLPPVDATAFVLGSAHFVTFDGKLGRFDKTCQYLLASDFVGKNFSVVVDLGNENSASGAGVESLSITDGKNTVSIGYNEIFVNGQSYNTQSAPSRVGSFKLSEEYGWFKVVGDMGVTVGCQVNREFPNPEHLCAIQVSGFYHGKIQGVLGVYDNELKDEYKLPTGQVTENNAVFLKSWKLNKQCQGKNNWQDIFPQYNYDFDDGKFDIDTFFSISSSSPLRKYRSAETLNYSSSASSLSATKIAGAIIGMLVLLSFVGGYFGL